MYSLLCDDRRNKLRLFTELANYLDGNMAEVGVYQGGSAEVIANNKHESKKLFLFDTFIGMPKSSQHDNIHKEGDFNQTSYNQICSNFKNYKNVFVYQGIFPKQNADKVQDEKFNLVHLDVDIYQSYKDCLEFFYPKLVDGGFLILDDYGETACLGAKLAIDKFLMKIPEKLIWTQYCQVVIIKNSGGKFLNNLIEFPFLM